MTTKLLPALALLALMACGPTAADDFRDGFPRKSTVALSVPQSGQGVVQEGVRRDMLLNDPSFFYGLTRATTVLVNGAVVFELNLLEDITSNPPTTLTADTAVWGPGTDPLARTTWRFTVTRTAPDHYTYTLEGKAKGADDSTYQAVISGSHVSAGRGYGSGTFTVDWNAGSRLPDHDGNVGSAVFSYARPDATSAVTVNADFTQVKDGNALRDIGYRFSQTPGGGGSFQYSQHQDLVPGPGLELLTVKSRWQQDGAGRSDARLSGGDLTADTTANECWDSSFVSKYFVLAAGTYHLGWGLETSCAFAQAEYASP